LTEHPGYPEDPASQAPPPSPAPAIRIVVADDETLIREALEAILSLQADIDVVGNGELPFHFEVDLPLVMAEALNNLPIPHVRVLVNNRKVVQGVCESLGVTDVEAALRGLDKIDKIGPEGVVAELAQSGIDGDQASVLLQMAQIRTSESSEVRARLADLGVGGDETVHC